MKRIAILAVVLFAAMACEKPVQEDPIVYLEVNYNNISGSWALDSYDGEALADGVFQYLNFERASKEFQEYTNISSQYTVSKSGKYQLSDTEYGQTRIRGTYPMELEKEWNHAYIISELTADRMVWTAEDDETLVNVYVRAEIPSDITGEPAEE